LSAVKVDGFVSPHYRYVERRWPKSTTPKWNPLCQRQCDRGAERSRDRRNL